MNISQEMSCSKPPTERIFRDLLLAAALSRDDLATFLEVHADDIRDWCNGSKPVPRMAILALERVVQLGHVVQSEL